MAEGAAAQEGPEAGPGEHHFLGGWGQGGALQEKPGGATCPWGRGRAGAGCSKKDLRQAQGLRARLAGLRGLPGQPGPGSSPDCRGCRVRGSSPLRTSLLSPWKGAGEPVVQICGSLSYGGRLCPKVDIGVRPLHHLGLHRCPQYSRFS